MTEDRSEKKGLAQKIRDAVERSRQLREKSRELREHERHSDPERGMRQTRYRTS